jgi:hypothetical protein
VARGPSIDNEIELDRDAYLKRTLALELLRLDQLEMAFEGKGLRDGDASATHGEDRGKARDAVGLNPPLGRAVRVVSHPPEHRETPTACAIGESKIRGYPPPDC